MRGAPAVCDKYGDFPAEIITLVFTLTDVY